jgi:ATP-dependent Clp protease ATP-binding subunit ClpB
LEVSEGAVQQIALEGFDPVYGARPLKRAIQKEIENPLAMRLIEGSFHDGDTIRVEVDPEGRFTFQQAGDREPVTA